MDAKRPGCGSFPLNNSYRNGSVDRISFFLGGCNAGRGRLESLLQHSTKTDICKEEPELKKKLLGSTYSDYEERRNRYVISFRPDRFLSEVYFNVWSLKYKLP